MNKTLIARLITLGAVVTTIAGFGTVNYNEATGTSLTSKIAELKELALDWKENASEKDQLISEKEAELKALQDKYSSILTLLGISDMNADETTIKNAINSMNDTQTLADIATALGIDSTASKEDILNEIRVTGDTITTLKASIDDLEKTVGQLEDEIIRLQGEVDKANTAEQTMLTAVETAIDEIGTPVDDENETTLTEEQQALKATMDEAWQTVLDNNNEELDSTYMERLRTDTYKLYTSNSKNEVGFENDTSSWKTIDWASYQALQAYQTARTAFINAGGEL